jgi:hypothetical protein
MRKNGDMGFSAQEWFNYPKDKPLTPALQWASEHQAARRNARLEKPHFDYVNQAWVSIDGKYLRCGHRDSFPCNCYGRAHEGEEAPEAKYVPSPPNRR